MNRLVDIIAYLRLSPEDGKRYIYTRGNDKFEAGARFPYLKPKIEMSYDNLVEELYSAIEQQANQDQTELKEEEKALSFEEYHRLLYVALTRAEECLCICGYKNKSKVCANFYKII